jgi:hypothetical protein
MNRSHGFAIEARRLADLLIPAMRERARRLGYALAVHGSLEYDIDLVAAPWTEQAVAADELAEKLRTCCEAITGFAWVRDDKEWPERKPHGRLAWSWHMGGGPYIDLSVMPRSEKVSSE